MDVIFDPNRQAPQPPPRVSARAWPALRRPMT